jgi:hypothetical protein
VRTDKHNAHQAASDANDVTSMQKCKCFTSVVAGGRECVDFICTR